MADVDFWAPAIGGVVGLTLLFDLADLSADARTYRFLYRPQYLTYMALRSVLGTGALVVIEEQAPDMPGILMVVFAVFASISVIQSFNFTVGADRIVALDASITRFRQSVIDDARLLLARRDTNERYELAGALSLRSEEFLLGEFNLLIGRISEGNRDELQQQFTSQLEALPNDQNAQRRARVIADAIVAVADALADREAVRAILSNSALDR